MICLIVAEYFKTGQIWRCTVENRTLERARYQYEMGVPGTRVLECTETNTPMERGEEVTVPDAEVDAAIERIRDGDLDFLVPDIVQTYVPCTLEQAKQRIAVALEGATR